jgi:hypothetical protein
MTLSVVQFAPWFVFGLVFSFLLGLVFLFFMLADWLLLPQQLWNTQNLIIGSSLNSFQVLFKVLFLSVLLCGSSHFSSEGYLCDPDPGRGGKLLSLEAEAKDCQRSLTLLS